MITTEMHGNCYVAPILNYSLKVYEYELLSLFDLFFEFNAKRDDILVLM